MASVQQKGDSYYCQFSFNGKRHTVTVGRVTRKRAEAFAAGVEDLLDQVRRGRLAIPPGVTVPDFVLSDGKATPPAAGAEAVQKDLALGQLLDRYVAAVGGGALEASTVATLKIHAKHLKRLLGEKTPVLALDRDALQGYVARRSAERHHGSRLHPDTPKKELATLRTAWHWGVQGRLLAAPYPGARLRYGKKEEAERFMTWAEVERRVGQGGDPERLWPSLYLTRLEVDEFLSYARDHGARPWVYPLLVFVAHTGARRSEALRAELADVDLEAGAVTVRERKRVRGVFSTRRVPMSPYLAGVLQEWAEAHPGSKYLFAQAGKAPTPVSRDELVHHFRMTVGGGKWEVLRGLHVLRHSFISLCASRGVDQRLIDEWTGHSTEEQRRRYRHLFPDVQRKAISEVFG